MEDKQILYKKTTDKIDGEIAGGPGNTDSIQIYTKQANRYRNDYNKYLTIRDELYEKSNQLFREYQDLKSKFESKYSIMAQQDQPDLKSVYGKEYIVMEQPELLNTTLENPPELQPVDSSIYTKDQIDTLSDIYEKYYSNKMDLIPIKTLFELKQKQIKPGETSGMELLAKYKTEYDNKLSKIKDINQEYIDLLMKFNQPAQASVQMPVSMSTPGSQPPFLDVTGSNLIATSADPTPSISDGPPRLIPTPPAANPKKAKTGSDRSDPALDKVPVGEEVPVGIPIGVPQNDLLLEQTPTYTPYYVRFMKPQGAMMYTRDKTIW